MAGLTRNGPKLLSIVRGKPHATQDDHADEPPSGWKEAHQTSNSLPTPPASNSTRDSSKRPRSTRRGHVDTDAEPTCSEDDNRNSRKGTAQKPEVDKEDITRDPDSSEDELSKDHEAPKGFLFPSRGVTKAPSDSPKPSAFTLAKGVSMSPSKRSAEDDSDPNGEIFGSQVSSQPKRRKKNGTTNIHAQPQRPIYSSQMTYGKRRNAFESMLPRDKGKQEAGQKSKTAKAKAKPKSPEESKPTFKQPKGAKFVEKDGAATFNPAKITVDLPDTDAGAQLSRSPSLSSLSEPPESPEVSEVDALGLPAAKQYRSTIECTICGKEVDRFLKADFEDKYNRGRQMTYKWQQRFCRWHNESSARELWKERGYPEIDWEGLDRRLKKHHAHILAVLEQRVPSVYRDMLQRRIKAGVKKFQHIVEGKGGRNAASIGYYGPRGEKAIMEHIVTNFSARMRELAATDKLIAASGIVGGVSGFVQAVLTPEMAVQLVKDDMKVGDGEARDILDESTELGQVLNEEVEERLGTRDDEVIEVD